MKESDFELESMTKETAGTKEVLGQYFRVEVESAVSMSCDGVGCGVWKCVIRDPICVMRILSQDMFDFDNMGFTNTVENIKYLSCSDCEVTGRSWELKRTVLTLSRSYTPQREGF